jgi:glycosyltransferase involved in cell wall biosynthesis
LLDDTVVSGKVKPVLTLAGYARDHRESQPSLEISMLTFVRGESDPEFVRALARDGFAIDVVRERRRFDLGVFRQLREIVARRKPHVLWTHGAKTHFLVRVAGLHRDAAWVASHHGYTATSLTWRLYDQLDRWSLRGADSVIAACEAFAVDLHTRLRIPKARLSVHRSPIAIDSTLATRAEHPSIRAALGLPANARIVLSVGRLSKEKAHADLIRAMPMVKRDCNFPVALVIVGDGPEERRLESLSAQLGVAGAVHLAGYQDDVSPYYEAADVFALTSSSEGSPNVLLEAMDAGVPILATSVGGVVEIIRHREEGWLVESGDVEAIARGLVALLVNPALGEALRLGARRSLAAYAPERYYVGVRSVFEKARA